MVTTPISKGKAGEAWEIQVAPAKPDHLGTLKAWLLHLPGAHPFWSYYELGVVMLRDIPGGKPAVKHYPEAQYELLVIALHPDYIPSPTDINTLVPLTPPNYVNQFHEVTDAEAVEVGLTMVNRLVNGILPIEPEGIYGARKMWAKTIERLIIQLHMARPVKGDSDA